MNLVLDEAEEISLKRKSRAKLGTIHFIRVYYVSIVCALLTGRILLKGDNISLMFAVKSQS